MSESRVIVGLVNPKSPENVGSIMRAAGNYGVDRVCYTGKRYPRALMRNPDLPDLHRKVGQTVPLAEVSSIPDDLPSGAKLVCVELVEGAIPLPEFKHPEQACYVFGPEDGSIGQSLIDEADEVVYIPTVGCMNLAASVNVVLYDRLSKSFQGIAGDDLIRKNRDANNRLCIKQG